MSEERLDLSKLPSHLKLQLLSSLSSKPTPKKKPNTTNNNNAKKPAISTEDIEFVHNLMSQIRQKGYFICDNFVKDEKVILNAMEEIQQMKEQGKLKHAGMGAGAAKFFDEKARGDFHCWLDEHSKEMPTNIVTILSSMTRIRHSLNQKYSISLDKESVQVALYPPNGARYVRHSDATLLQSPERRFTILFYFNKEHKGGELKLYLNERSHVADEFIYSHPASTDTRAVEARDTTTTATTTTASSVEEAEGTVIQIEPKYNRLVVFPSELYHEVLPSYSPRYALSMWLYSDDMNIYSKINQYFSNQQQQVSSSSTTSSTTSSNSTSSSSSTFQTGNDTTDTIFVSICSYRDSELQHTVDDLFKKAQHPERLRIGICWQYDDKEDAATCFTKVKYYEAEYGAQIKEIYMNHNAAKGPTLARHLIQRYLYDGETYYLQIDSHMRFEKNWDTLLIAMLHQCEAQSKKAIISTYPTGYELPNKIPEHAMPTLICAKEFVKTSIPQAAEGTSFDYDMLRLCGRIMTEYTPKHEQESMIRSLFWAAGYHFSRGSLVTEVPYDADTPYLFFGEELIMLYRFFTYGYTIFAPNQVLCYHLWNRDYRPTIFSDQKSGFQTPSSTTTQTVQELVHSNPNRKSKIIDIDAQFLMVDDSATTEKKKIQSCKRVLKQLGIYFNSASGDEELKPFAMGSKQSLQEFEAHVGVHFAGKTIDSKAKFGGYSGDYLI